MLGNPAKRDSRNPRPAGTRTGQGRKLDRRLGRGAAAPRVEGRLATRAAQIGMAAFSYAAEAWIEDPTEGLDAHLDCAFEQLRVVSSTNPRPDPDGG